MSDEYPPLTQQAQSAARAALRFARCGFATVDQAEFERRLEICRACPDFDAGSARCRLCGCRTALKLRSAAERCPADPPRWDAVTSPITGSP